MKRTPLLSILVLTNIALMNAQDYQTFSSQRIAYFADRNGAIRCVRIDSVKHLTDSVFYPMSSIQQLDYDCFTPYGASWTGKKIIIRGNGDNLFFNREMDTIRIKTGAGLNEEWTAYELPDSVKIMATVKKIEKISFLGLQDSVKTIAFQHYDKDMNPVAGNLDTTTLMLSKNYGLIRTMNFYLFPNYTSGFPYQEFEGYELAGLSDPEAGVKNITWFDVNDFQVGDELHMIYESSNWGMGDDYHIIAKTICRYLEREDHPDSIVYWIDRTMSQVINDTEYFYSHDTIFSHVSPDTVFDKLPGEPVVTESMAYTHSMTADSKSNPNTYIYPGADSCWTNCCDDECSAEYLYRVGLGGPYYECYNALTLGTTSNSLVYYKKGQTTWGTPLTISAIKPYPEEMNITIYPNPAADRVFIKTPASILPFTFVLTDINGRLLISIQINETEYSLEPGPIAPGIYFYRIICRDRPEKCGKLILRGSETGKYER